VRRYRYVGPEAVRRSVAGHAAGAPVRTSEELGRVLAELGEDEPCTYVITLGGELRLADRRSEHVACAGGEEVLAAGELAFERERAGWRVTHASNQSTGYCPEPSSWGEVERALDTIGVRHGGGFTHALVFRLCNACGERNIVKDSDFACEVCGAELPREWNFEG
jgi:hypothetical protein